jgi:hypothetical protein
VMHADRGCPGRADDRRERLHVGLFDYVCRPQEVALREGVDEMQASRTGLALHSRWSPARTCRPARANGSRRTTALS